VTAVVRRRFDQHLDQWHRALPTGPGSRGMRVEVRRRDPPDLVDVLPDRRVVPTGGSQTEMPQHIGG